MNLDLYLQVAHKLTNIEYVHNNIKANKINYEKYGKLSDTFFPLSLSHGYPGIAMLFTNIGKITKDERWYKQAHSYIKEIVNNIKEYGITTSPGLFSGISGLALAIKYCGLNNLNYSELLNSLLDILYRQLNEKIPSQNTFNNLNIFEYDVSEGISGICNFLITLDRNQLDQEKLNDCIDYLVELSCHSCNQTPKWLIENTNLLSKHEIEYYKSGILNTGMSHGIIGPLIALCNIQDSGYGNKKVVQAIKTIVEDLSMLFEKAYNSVGGVLPSEQYCVDDNITENNPRNAWCYGNLGAAYGLLRASEILNSNTLQNIAVDYMKSSLMNDNNIYSPSFCHGFAGNLYIYKQFYEKTQINAFHKEVLRLKSITEKFFHDEIPFGFYDIEFINDKKIALNSIGLLQGVSGILLVLLSFEKASDNSWDTFFMLNS